MKTRLKYRDTQTVRRGEAQVKKGLIDENHIVRSAAEIMKKGLTEGGLVEVKS